MATKISGSTKTTSDYSNLRNSNMPKFISYFFLISQFISGIDFGFSKLFSKNIQNFIRNFTVFEACMYSVIIIAPILFYPTTYRISIVVTYLFQYILNVVIFLKYKKYNIYDFLCNISEFCMFTRNDTYILIILTIINAITDFSLKLISVIMIKVYDLKIEPFFDQLPLIYYLFMILNTVINDLVAIAQIVIFYYVYYSMKHLKVMLVSSDWEVNLISKRYKVIMDICENIRPLSDVLVSIIFLA